MVVIAAMIALFMILLVDIPLCVLTLIGYPVTMTLSPLIPSREEREKWREMRGRLPLSDDEFIEQFYSGTSVPRDIPLRLRQIYAHQLGMDKVHPKDLATDFDWELDLWELVLEVQDEFGVEFTKEEILKLDGSFDSIVRAVATKRFEQMTSHEQNGNGV